ncbi:MAG: glutamine-hydrolyzing GMP synthase, partial [Pseudomonadota bacterium]
LSGSPSSCIDESAPRVSPELFSLGVPVLGICYGAQLTALLFGGRVAAAAKREYGFAKVRVLESTGIFAGFESSEETAVWMSHGDQVEQVPPGFAVVGETSSCAAAAFVDAARRLYCVQFHPEVAHTARGRDILANFLFRICGASPGWTMASFIDGAVDGIRDATSGGGRVLCALSGGVDSAVACALVQRAVGDRLTSIFVDNGLLRRGERDNVAAVFRGHSKVDLRVVDAEERFLSALAEVSDPESKRKIIGKQFIDVFEDEAKSVGGARWLVQGTLYPDVIESVSFRGPSATIKSHHNVGGLPERMNLGLVEPLRELFKDEVRRLGEELGLPHHVLWRQPFPGPGLAVRCLGHVTKERLEKLRAADAIIEEEIRAADLYEAIWQSFGVLLSTMSVGVVGDCRSYAEVLALRAVTSQDGMTADWVPLPGNLLATISRRIVNEVRGISRVVYDITSKPPATIEWE